MEWTSGQRHTLLMCSLIFCSLLIYVSLYHKFHKKSSDYGNDVIEEINKSNKVKRVKRGKLTQLKEVFKFGRVCTTKRCKEIGNLYNRIINKSVDPCDDFYEYVCGKYDQNDETTADLITFQSSDLNIMTTLVNHLNQTTVDSDPTSVKFATNIFKGCIDSKTLDSRGVQPLIKILNVMEGWPLIRQKTPFDDKNYNRLDALAKFIALFAQNGIIGVNVSPDLFNNSRNIINFEPAPYLFDRDNIFESQQERFRSLPKSVFPKIRKFETTLTKINENFNIIMEKVVAMGGQNNHDTRQQIKDLLTFASKLVEISKVQNNNDEEFGYQRITFKQLNHLSPQINWLYLANKINFLVGSEYRYMQDHFCGVSGLEYFIKLSQILSETSDEIIANFLGYKIVQWFGVYTHSTLRQLSSATPPWFICLTLLEENMGFALSRIYVEQHFNQTNRIQVTKLTENIQDSFYDIIDMSPLFNDFSRIQSLDKLKAIRINVGYPDWLFNNSILDSQYDLQKSCETKKVFECILHLLKQEMYLMFNSIDKNVNLTIISWIPSALTTVNAAYIPWFNSITIPAAIINTFFSIENPGEVNYGKIGDVIGHELTHAFGNSGSLFDSKGNLAPIWDMTTQNRFEDHQKCFIDEYNKLCEYGFCVNGENTLEENSADNGGIIEAFLAFQMSKMQRSVSFSRLPFVTEYTPKQLFFISYATVWCDNSSPEFIKAIYLNENHSPPKFRVNAVLANIPSFADSFKCPINSTMNPIMKCSLWNSIL